MNLRLIVVALVAFAVGHHLGDREPTREDIRREWRTLLEEAGR